MKAWTLRLIVSPLAAVSALLPGLASAGLLGTPVDVRYHFADGSLSIDTLDSVVVAPGAEITCPGAAQLCQALTAPTQTLDFGDTSIRYDYVGLGGQTGGFNDVPVNRFEFQSLFSEATLTGVQLTTNILGLDASRLSFSAHAVELDMRGLPLASQAFFQLDLQATPVPEPSRAVLLAISLTALIGMRRKRYRESPSPDGHEWASRAGAGGASPLGPTPGSQRKFSARPPSRARCWQLATCRWP